MFIMCFIAVEASELFFDRVASASPEVDNKYRCNRHKTFERCLTSLLYLIICTDKVPIERGVFSNTSLRHSAKHRSAKLLLRREGAKTLELVTPCQHHICHSARNILSSIYIQHYRDFSFREFENDDGTWGSNV
jgi:hypothetical protein